MFITSHDFNGEIGALVGTKSEGFCEVCDAMPGDLHRAPEPKYTYADHKHNRLKAANWLASTDIRVLSMHHGTFIGKLAELVDHPNQHTFFAARMTFYDLKNTIDAIGERLKEKNDPNRTDKAKENKPT